MNSLVDTRVDYVGGSIRKPVIDSRLLIGWTEVCSCHREGKVIPVEEKGEDTSHRAGEVVCPGAVVRIVRRCNQGQPGRISYRPRVAVIVPFLNSRNRPPGNIKILCIPRSDQCI